MLPAGSASRTDRLRRAANGGWAGGVLAGRVALAGLIEMAGGRLRSGDARWRGPSAVAASKAAELKDEGEAGEASAGIVEAHGHSLAEAITAGGAWPG